MNYFIRFAWMLGSCTLLLISANVYSQKMKVGAFFMTGNSRGVDNSPTLTTAVDDYQNGFVQPGIYALINYRPDSIQTSLKFIRVDLGVASRAGTFDLGNQNLARITTSAIDLTVLLPFSFQTSREIEGYAAVGAVASYQYSRKVVATQIPPAVGMNTINPGFALELGFKWGGSFIGYRTMIQFNDYPCRVGALTFGFCPYYERKKK